jgi:hypothetical protein
MLYLEKKINMKNYFIAALLVMCFQNFSFAQEISDNTIGLRLGSNDGFGAEISYQKALGSNNRGEINLGLRSSDGVNAVKIVGLYQWVWLIDGNFNWYAGAGAGVGSWKSDYTSNFFGLLAGDIGVEYAFDELPILISLDFRPEFGLGDYYGRNYGSDIGFGIRYQF